MPPADYSAALESAAVFPLPGLGLLEVSGPDAPAFLTNLSTNDLNAIPAGGGCETYFLDHRAKVQFHTFAFHVLRAGKHAIHLSTTQGRGEALLQRLDKYLISEAVELADLSEKLHAVHLVGPNAPALLPGVPPLLDPFAHADATLHGIACSVRRTDRLGLPGYDIVSEVPIPFDCEPGTPESFEILRIEAGIPVWGIDYDESRFVMELPAAARAVNYAKGCFLGQEPIVMARDRAGFVNRSFVGVAMAAPATGPVLRDGKDVGEVTSVTLSPRKNAAVAVGFLRRGHLEPGTAVEIAGTPATVLGWPPVA
jgi:tRNA-modifying protein YgfZ